MQFFTEYAKRKSTTLTSVTDASAAVDGDKSSFVNAPSAMPRLRVDLETAQVVDAVWAKADQGFNLYAGNTIGSLSSIASGIQPADGVSYHELANQATFRYYQLRFSGSGDIYEVMLLRNLFEVPDPQDIDEEPFFPVSARASALRYDSLARSGAGQKLRLTCEWRQLAYTDANLLKEQWELQEPVTVALDPETERIWTMRLSTEIGSDFTHTLTSLGRTVRLNFEEAG